MIGKKDQKPLNFLVLPGKELFGTFHESVEVRGITLVGIKPTNSPFTQDFAGKFWWDEENIINAQVQAAREENTSANTNNTQSSQQDNTAINEAQLKDAYNAKIAEYAKYQGQKISGTITEVEGVNKIALNDFGSDISYALFDLNGDGTDELLIGCGTDSTIADAFTFENGQVKRILFSWARSYYEMCENGY